MVRDVRLILLGTGTSSGVPVIGCDCAVCTSDDPRDRRLRCSAYLHFVDGEGRERAILIDASPDLREQALRHRLDRCDAIFFTHNHVDHTFGLDEVRRFNVLMRASIDVWADEHTMKALHRIYRHIFERHRNENVSFVATLVPRLIEPERPIDACGLRITPIKLLHGKLPVLGYRIDALDSDGSIAAEQPGPLPAAYCTDVSGIPPESWAKLTGLQTLVLDLLRYRKHPTHFNMDEAVHAAEQIAADETWFIHMTHDISHAELDPKLPNSMFLGYDGVEITGKAMSDGR